MPSRLEVQDSSRRKRSTQRPVVTSCRSSRRLRAAAAETAATDAARSPLSPPATSPASPRRSDHPRKRRRATFPRRHSGLGAVFPPLAWADAGAAAAANAVAGCPAVEVPAGCVGGDAAEGVMTATSATGLAIRFHGDGGGPATGTADENPFRPGAAAAPGLRHQGAAGSSALPPETV